MKRSHQEDCLTFSEIIILLAIPFGCKWEAKDTTAPHYSICKTDWWRTLPLNLKSVSNLWNCKSAIVQIFLITCGWNVQQILEKWNRKHRRRQGYSWKDPDSRERKNIKKGWPNILNNLFLELAYVSFFKRLLWDYFYL